MGSQYFQALPIIVIIGFIEIIKILINKFIVKSKLTSKEQSTLFDLHRILTKTDGDSVPLCYVPRSLGANQKELIATLREISTINMKQTLILERLEKLLEGKIK